MARGRVAPTQAPPNARPRSLWRGKTWHRDVALHRHRIAARLAKRRKCRALCTGENLGQVASQTLENLTVVDRLTDLLTLRPLITFDKVEIMAIARRIGTYDTSVLPYDDCCTLFVPRNPAIKASIKALEKAERRLEVEALVEQALAATEEVRLGADGQPIVAAE